MNKICQIANESIELNIKIKLRVSKILQRYSKAASPLTNCGCQCSSLTFSDSAGVVQVLCMYFCTFVLLYGYTFVLLYFYLLYFCTFDLFYFSTSELLYFCTSNLLYFCTFEFLQANNHHEIQSMFFFRATAALLTVQELAGATLMQLLDPLARTSPHLLGM